MLGSRVLICRFRMTGRRHGPANGRVGVVVIIVLSSSDCTAVVWASWEGGGEQTAEGGEGGFSFDAE